jgi:hypothetical protein
LVRFASARWAAPLIEKATGTKIDPNKFEAQSRDEFYAQLIKDGLAIEQASDLPAPSIRGQSTKKIDSRGNKSIWVRSDIAPEIKQAKDLEGPIANAGFVTAAHLNSQIQLAGPTDAVWHVGNMISTIGGSQGGRTVLHDLARKFPGVQLLDTLTRTTASAIKVLRDSPEMQKSIMDLVSKVPGGAAAGKATAKGIFKLMPDTTPEVRRKLAELTRIGAGREAHGSGFTGNLINLIDKAGRLVLNDLYNNLVKRGLPETEFGRREFVNQLGQYNPRLMGQLQRVFKEAGFSPFVVAGRTMNKNMLRRIALSQAVEGASPQMSAMMKAVDAFGVIATLIAVPALINYMVSGNPQGKPGLKQGQILTSKKDANGNDIIIDLAQLSGMRRGLRITGLDALIEGMKKGEPMSKIKHDMGRDILAGWIHPWAGPAVSTPVIMATGYTPTFHKESPDPYDYGENTKAALKQLNPIVGAIFKSQEESPGVSGAIGGTLKSLSGAIGVKTAYDYTAGQQIRNKVKSWMEGSEDPKLRAEAKRKRPQSEYSGLTDAVEAGNQKLFDREMSKLLEVKDEKQVMKLMKEHMKTPFAGSKANEKRFIDSLTDEELKVYDKARDEQADQYSKFLDMLDASSK